MKSMRCGFAVICSKENKENKQKMKRTELTTIIIKFSYFSLYFSYVLGVREIALEKNFYCTGVIFRGGDNHLKTTFIIFAQRDTVQLLKTIVCSYQKGLCNLYICIYEIKTRYTY